jgi:hypothetical protein
MTWLWLATWCGPALLGLFCRRAWVAALLIVLNAVVLALLLAVPDVGLAALAVLYLIALLLVITARRRPPRAPDSAVVQERLAELRRLNENQCPW